MVGLCVGYDRHAVGQTCAIWQAYLFRAHANNVKCMYTSAPSHTVDSSESICMQMQMHTLLTCLATYTHKNI